MPLSTYHNNTATVAKVAKAITADTFGAVLNLSTLKGTATMIVNASAGTADSGVVPAMTVAIWDAADTGDTYAANSNVSFTASAATAVHQAVAVDLDLVKKYAKLKFDLTGANAAYTVAATLFSPASGM